MAGHLTPDLATPWDIAVDICMKEHGVSLVESKDFVILHWLVQGDTRAYSAFTARGHSPGREVSRYLGMMLNPQAQTENVIPYSLEIGQRGKRGRRTSPETRLRDRLVFEQVTNMKAQRISYDEALERVSEMFPGDQRETIEKAYKNECARRR